MLPPIQPGEKSVLHDQPTDLSSYAYAAVVWVIGMNEAWPRGSYTSPPIQSRCSKTASFRATATVARFLAFFPPRVHSFFSESSQIGIRSERTEDVVGAAHQQFAQHPVARLADA